MLSVYTISYTVYFIPGGECLVFRGVHLRDDDVLVPREDLGQFLVLGRQRLAVAAPTVVLQKKTDRQMGGRIGERMRTVCVIVKTYKIMLY
jgi:hypothetical protein